MYSLLTYPFDSQLILKKRKSIRRELIEKDTYFIEKNIAILGGSTTHDIKEILEIFLLSYGIKPKFYESEFGQYWNDAMFNCQELEVFQPDIIFIHTSNRNITLYPTVKNSTGEVCDMLNEQFEHFRIMWDKLYEKYNCPIIQNNFEMPFYRILGNRDAYDIHGRTNFITRLNQMFYEYAEEHEAFFINDINYLSASYGLEKWSDTLYWHMYKYCLCTDAIPAFSFNVANIIKSIFGKNKKSLVLDLDNTIWGGVVGDDGVEGIEIGHETSMGQVFSEFQAYVKSLKDLGIILNVNSKNNIENAIAGLKHPESTLSPDDFILIKANWQNKDINLSEISAELSILPESFVFIDDNPVEREIVKMNIPDVCAPEIGSPENYINIIDKSGFFEVTTMSADDLKRNEMYKENAERSKAKQSFINYTDYLKSLDMKAKIHEFEPVYLSRITQLTNKSNQFNLTTRRYTESDIEAVANNDEYISLYGKLTDKYGDNGIITVVIGRIETNILHIELWLMSCRVLKRNIEHAMLDELIKKARAKGIAKLRGYYYKTAKNNMVKNFYCDFGFCLVSQDGDDTVWELDITDYKNKNDVIFIENQKDI